MSVDLRDLIFKYALKNAIEHEGKADKIAVMNKIFVEVPELKQEIKDVSRRDALMSLVNEIVEYVNSLSYDEQVKLMEEEYGITIQMIEEEKATKTRIGLPELPNASKGKVITRFAPAPTGALHLGQILRAAYLSWYYARRYDGKFILRIEDTDPRRIRLIYYDWIQEDLRSLGLDWDELVCESDHFEIYYELTYKLFENGKAYVCLCSSEEFKRNVARRKPCEHREKMDTVDYWENMLQCKYREGEAIVRLKTNLELENPALIDPPLLRIIETVPHPRTGYNYKIYPLYNYACIIEDHYISKITHVIRAKEHETNRVIQNFIADAFNWKLNINYIEYGMVTFEGAPAHKRHIRSALRSKEISGWEDSSLVTIRALIRRGIHPDAIKMLAEHVGMTKNDIKDMPLVTLYSFNSKVLSKIAKRIFFVEDPIVLKVYVEDDLFLARNPWIPGNEAAGYREYRLRPLTVDGKKVLNLYISREDVDLLRRAQDSKSPIRLKGLMNCRIVNIDLMNNSIYAEQLSLKPIRGVEIIHWVPAGDLAIKAFVETPSGIKEGYVEFLAQQLKNGEYVQMERYGFGRIIQNEGEVIFIAFAHK
ncbi:MAG: glutamate--tRNA ligase [Candidatus Korarchaeota archaeon]|nr:glutamate--tRNA ligase [Thermoproteota archaeon]MCR8455650.1 glutamate--tRNA ligase [Thermoproteota archaeon]MCR8462874.1 glutamate--tRNA ligase [Thermoproteota archaeon]MCR8470984.1 glutamate--tRNA ligase [Thermoproteota archaeon]MCR8471797.1 glutamate--tRNA ligase [Thermoproteota archaeon]